MAIYMEYEGIKGNVTATGYVGTIQLRYFTYGMYREISMKTGQLSNREYTKPTFRVMTVGKKLDAASAGIFKEAVSGATGKRVILHFVRTGKNQLEEYMTITLEQCLPVFFQFIAMSYEGNSPIESLSLSYTSAEVSYINSGADNKMLSVQRHSYDLAEAKSL